MLRELLKDESESFAYLYADTITTVSYTVREAAYESLKALGKPVPDVQLERKPTDDEKRSVRHGYWQSSLASALPEGWKVVSVEDGRSQQIQGLGTVAVVVTCAMGWFTLHADVGPCVVGQGELPGRGGPWEPGKQALLPERSLAF